MEHFRKTYLSLNKGEEGGQIETMNVNKKLRNLVLKAFNGSSINGNRNISEKCSEKEVPQNYVVCTENCSQNL